MYVESMYYLLPLLGDSIFFNLVIMMGMAWQQKSVRKKIAQYQLPDFTRAGHLISDAFSRIVSSLTLIPKLKKKMLK